MGLTGKLSLCLFLVTALVAPPRAHSAWQGPMEVLAGAWGIAQNEFGIEKGDMSDRLPWLTAILHDGKLVISDKVNERELVYANNGAVLEVVSWYVVENGTKSVNPDYPKYKYWNVQGYTSDGSIWWNSGTKYFLRSSTGEILQAKTQRPVELGRVKKLRWGEDDYKVTVEYPDKIWGISGTGAFGRYMRDMSGTLYGVASKLVARYSDCGVEVAELTLPPDKIKKIEAGVPGIEPMIKVIEEYGVVVLGPNGDVYTWKRTETNYSILKWTWQDDSNAPTGSPEAPWGCRVSLSSSGLTLKWVLSAQDPGCVTGYEIARSTTPGSGYSTIATVEKGVTTYEDSGVTQGTYYYKVRAMAGSDAGAYSDEVSGTF